MKIFILIFCTLVTVIAVQVSSKVDLDSDTDQCCESSSDNSDPMVIVVEHSNTEHKAMQSFRTGGSRPRVGGNVNVRGPLKPIRSHDIYPHSLLPTQPKVIKNIYIILHGTGSEASSGSRKVDCKEGVCETTLTMETDEDGNVISSVHLTIITNMENVKVDDIPVIDGVRGSGFGNDDHTPTFAFNNGRASPHPPFLGNDIPQVPVYRRHQLPRRDFARPQSGSFYPHNFGNRKDPSTWSPWIPVRSFIDDKIEPPLSKTNTGDQ